MVHTRHPAFVNLYALCLQCQRTHTHSGFSSFSGCRRLGRPPVVDHPSVLARNAADNVHTQTPLCGCSLPRASIAEADTRMGEEVTSLACDRGERCLHTLPGPIGCPAEC